jgi:hypothetical protein
MLIWRFFTTNLKAALLSLPVWVVNTTMSENIIAARWRCFVIIIALMLFVLLL